MRISSCARAIIQANNASQAINPSLQRPYEVEGGCVPIYQMTNGKISKRNWVARNPDWCDICKEPVQLWANHHGRKDHALLDLHYGANVEFPRNWCPEELLSTFENALQAPIESYYYQYAEHDKKRRDEIFSLIGFLEREKVLHLGETRNTFLSRMLGGLRGMDYQGSLVLHEALLGPFMHLYPDGGIQDHSNLTDFITCAYNLETVYDLCGFQKLDALTQQGNLKLGASSPAALGLGGIATSSTAVSGFNTNQQQQSQQDAAGATMTEEEYAEAFSRKAVFIRSIFGQLRWATVEDQVHPTGHVYPHHIVLCCELLVKALVTELIAVRVCEYIVRAEPVWREFGLERKKLKAKEIMKRDMAPMQLRYSYRPVDETGDDLFTTPHAPSRVHEQAVAAIDNTTAHGSISAAAAADLKNINGRNLMQSLSTSLQSSTKSAPGQSS